MFRRLTQPRVARRNSSWMKTPIAPRRSRLPAETVAYLSGVTGRRSAAAVIVATAPRQLLFVLRHDLAEQQPPPTSSAENDGMFAIRKGVP